MLNDGELIIFPTDTVYGLGARVSDKLALQKIYDLKQRPPHKKIPILISNLIQINKIAQYSHRDFEIMKHFWPGNLTVILPTTVGFAKCTGESSIALRIPDSQVAQEILDTYGPMWVTSVNKSGEKALNDYDTIYQLFHDDVAKIIPPQQATSSNRPSTIINLCDPNKIILVREGDIKLNEILKFIHK